MKNVINTKLYKMTQATLHTFIVGIFPTLKLKTVELKDEWELKIKKDNIKLTRIYILAPILYMLHFYFLDLQRETGNLWTIWLPYRFGASLLGLLIFLSSFSQTLMNSRYYKIPMLIGSTMFIYMQSQAMIWQPITGYAYVFIMATIFTATLRLSLGGSYIYLTVMFIIISGNLSHTDHQLSHLLSATCMSFGAVGFLRVSMSSEVDSFMSDQIKIRLRNQLAKSLESTKHKEQQLEKNNHQISRKNFIFQTLMESSTKFQSKEDLSSLFIYALRQLGQLFPESSFAIILNGHRQETIECAQFRNFSDKAQKYIMGIQDELLKNQNNAVIKKNIREYTTSQSVQILPMKRRNGTVTGKLVITGEELNQQSIEVITLFLTLVTSFCDNLQLNQRLEKLANTDALTKTFNRNFFDKELKKEIEAVKKFPNLNFSILLIDVNGLKAVNDNHGHHHGDLMIRKVAHTLRNTCRKSDTVSRLGGDEFVILCPATANGEKLLERIREKEESLNMLINNKNISITLSIGLASTSECCPHETLKVADQRMYIDKKDFYERKTA